MTWERDWDKDGLGRLGIRWNKDVQRPFASSSEAWNSPPRSLPNSNFLLHCWKALVSHKISRKMKPLVPCKTSLGAANKLRNFKTKSEVLGASQNSKTLTECQSHPKNEPILSAPILNRHDEPFKSSFQNHLSERINSQMIQPSEVSLCKNIFKLAGTHECS